MVKQKNKKDLIIAPNEIIKVISSLDKKNYVIITNEDGKLSFNITYAVKNNKNICLKSKETNDIVK